MDAWEVADVDMFLKKGIFESSREGSCGGGLEFVYEVIFEVAES